MKKLQILVVVLLAVLLLTACGNTATPDVEAIAQPTNTSVPPTDTPVPPTATPTATPTVTPTPTPPAPPTARKFQITTDDEIQNLPAIYGDYVVWTDYRDGNVDIYAYNLTTEEEIRITTDEEQDSFPVVAGDLVVWLRKGHFYGYRLGTEDAEEFSVTSFQSVSTGCPTSCVFTFSGFDMALRYGARASIALSDRVLVWSDEETENISDILAFDLERETRIRITDDTPSQEWPAAAGNLIVWMDERNDAGDIYAYDLDTQEEFPIVTAPLTQTMPSTDGSFVVWIDERDGNDDIYGYNLETRTEFPIVTGPIARTLPAVWGNFVIWMEDRGETAVEAEAQESSEEWDIHGYDLLVGKEFPVVTEEGWQGNPRIWGNTVVWTEWKGIYGATLEY